MEKQTQKNLVFHAGAVMLLGMLSGIPFSMALMGENPSSIHDWSVSHMEGLINGILMLAIASVGSFITLSQAQEKWFYIFVVVTGYGNALYGWARGITGESGMDGSTTLASLIVQTLGALPVLTAFAFVIMLMIAAKKAN